MPTRLDLDSLSADELFSRGVAAARIGEANEARAMLTELTRREPGRADAWLWLASVESEPMVKRDFFRKVLELRPGDPEAKSGLDRLVAKYGAGILQTEEPTETMYCYWHPQRETRLRCTRCGRPICPACARPHPVGWRCKECARELRSPIYRVAPADLAKGFLAGLAVSAALALIVGLLGTLMWFLGILAAIPAGGAVGDMVSRAGRRKRGRSMQVAAAAAAAGGAALISMVLALGVLPMVLPIEPLAVGLYGVVGAIVAYGRLQ